jgi:hypothetical protein
VVSAGSTSTPDIAAWYCCCLLLLFTGTPDSAAWYCCCLLLLPAAVCCLLLQEGSGAGQLLPHLGIAT